MHGVNSWSERGREKGENDLTWLNRPQKLIQLAGKWEEIFFREKMKSSLGFHDLSTEREKIPEKMLMIVWKHSWKSVGREKKSWQTRKNSRFRLAYFWRKLRKSFSVFFRPRKLRSWLFSTVSTLLSATHGRIDPRVLAFRDFSSTDIDGIWNLNCKVSSQRERTETTKQGTKWSHKTFKRQERQSSLARTKMRKNSKIM